MGLDSPATCTGFSSPCTGVTTNGTINYGVIQYQKCSCSAGSDRRHCRSYQHRVTDTRPDFHCSTWWSNLRSGRL
jgi:hypothetical protein